MTLLKRIKNYVLSPRQVVSTPNGDKNIADVRVGDILLGRDNKQNVVQKIEVLESKNVKINGGKYNFTEKQKLLVNGKFVKAETIKVGDQLLDANNNVVKVSAVKTEPKKIWFFKFDLDGDRTYFIDGILVHNANTPRFWVGGTGNWDASTTTHWSDSSGGAGGQSVPDTDDDVTFDLHGNEATDEAYTVTITATANCANLDISFTGTTKVTLAGNSGLNIYGSLNFSGGTAQVTNNFTGAITMKQASGTQDMTFNGVPIKGHFAFSASSTTFRLLDGLTMAGSGKNLTRASGTFNANSQTVTMAGSGTNGINGGFTGSSSFYNLTITGSAVKTDVINFNDNITITGTLTINGNSAINRILITSDTFKTARTITAATVSVTNADFRDITGAGAGSWNLSAITGGSGNCGGCTNITFTTADDWYYHEAETGANNFSTIGKWFTATNGGGSVATYPPLPQDTAHFDINSFDSGSKTVAQDMPRIGSIDFTGATNTPTLNINSVAFSCYGSITLISGMNLTVGDNTITMYAVSASTITTAGKNILGTGGITYLDCYLYSSLTVQDDISFTGGIVLRNGTLTFTSTNVTIFDFISNQGAGYSSTLNMGSGLWTLTGENMWTINAQCTLNKDTANIKLTKNSSNNKQFAGGGKTYNDIWNATQGTGYLTITGSNTFNDFKIDAGRTVKFTNSTTTTVTTFTALGTSGSHIVISNTSSTTHATLAKAGGGTISGCDYIDIQEITGSPASTWYIGLHSTDVGSTCTNIILANPPQSYTKTLTDVIAINYSIAYPQNFTKVITETIQTISLSLKSSGRVFFQSINVGTLFNTTLTALKTLVESIGVLSKNIYQTSKTFIENIIVISKTIYQISKTLIENVVVAPVYSVVLTAYKVLTETIQVIGSVLNQTAHTLVETITASDTIQKGLAALKTLTETINIGDAISNILTAIKTFVEVVVVVPIQNTVLTAYKTLTESVKIVGNVIKNTGRTFVEVLAVVPVFFANSVIKKTLTETINVISQISFLTSRTFKETIKVISFIISQTSRVFFEELSVAVNLISQTSKTFVEVVNIIGTKLSQTARSFVEKIIVFDDMILNTAKTFSETLTVGVQAIISGLKLLIETVQVSSQKLFAMARVLIENVAIAGSSLYSTSKTFVENLGIKDAIITLFNRGLYEIVSVAEVFGNFVIGKVLSEIVKVYDNVIKQGAKTFVENITVGVNLVITWIKDLTETVAVAGTFVLGTISKLFIEVISVIGDAVKSMPKIFSENLNVSSLLNNAGQFYKILSESVNVIGNITRLVGRIIVETINISGQFILGTISKLFKETINVVVSMFNQAGKIFIENVIVSGQFILGTISKRLIEIVKVSQQFSNSIIRVFSETVNVVSTGIFVGSKLFIEVVNMVGTFVLGTISKRFIEVVNVSGNAIKVFPKVFVQSITVSSSAILTATKVLLENIKVAGSFILGTISKLFIEVVKVISSYTKIWTLSRVFTQTVKVVGSISQLGAQIILDEVVKVAGALQRFVIGKLLKETIVAHWAKIKLVLNGIQVGLWKKVARVTNGVWRKISRNDN